ncbi:hypothetical protein SDRG_16850 [Saprolegnia diclina VS20]|uniref:Uncharacterized protein n=1 Tax=Saprolegnia diclina (strain VS20) TaxID=1156394 RepID=T0PW57_SAPDV|nr:hypothetical protein SDRG_16850 [Saprolegnia diclina VS20]EQC25270.1 hypothetical protein SDRG_16850 [Saprolegnia diclina VS20]|eukprot:XP_008621295.1 hypothetical protein SDRG_16850 [Saprolegnia diclina VS20]
MWPTKATKELHEKQSALLDAAAAGNAAAVQAYLHDGVPITCTNESGSTSLHAAANYGHWDIVRLLLEKRVDVSAKDTNGSTPLHLAASKGHVAIVRSLLQKRAFIEAKTKDLETPLHYASKYNHVEVVRLLLAYGANLKVENNWHQTPLLLAHERGCVDVEDLLRKHPETLKLVAALRCKRIVSASKILEKDNINVNHRDRDKTPLLHLVLATQNFRLLETMLERPNLEVDATDATGMTALAIVLPTRSVEATYALLDLNAQLGAVSKTTVHAQMPLLAAVLRHATLNRNKGVVEVLLDHGVNPATTNEQGETALHLAAASGHTALVYTLLNHVQSLLGRSDQKDNTTVDVAVKGESCIDATNDAGESPLFVAAANGHADTVKALLHASASTHHVVTKDGSTLLHAAALSGKKNVLDQVLSLCSDVEACDERGHTPLHVAAAKGHASVVEYLVDAKANTFATTTTGDTPLTLATHPRVLAALKNAENEAKNELVDAVSTQQYDRVLTLLANGLSPNTTNKAGDSLLHLAVQGNDHAFLTALVRTPGLQMEIRNAAGVTPMTLAIQAGNRRLTSLLHAASHALKPEVSSDAYTMDVDAPLGVGGYGAVYKGTYNGRSVAIKTAVGPDGAATLLDETKTMLLYVIFHFHFLISYFQPVIVD